MSLQFRRGTEAQRDTSTFVPLSGEPIWTTDEKKLYVGDGSTPGGVEVSFTLNTSTTSTLGGVKIGSGISITADGTISASGGSAFDLSTVTNQALFTTSSVTFSNISVSNTVTTNNIQNLSGSIITLKQLTGVVIEGSTDGILYSKANNNLSLAADYPNSIGGRIGIQAGTGDAMYLGNHHLPQLVTINTSSGLTVHTDYAIRSDRFQGLSSGNSLFFGDGTSTAFLRPRSGVTQQNLRLVPTNDTGGYIEVQAGEDQGVRLGTHFNNNMFTINTATGVTVNSPVNFNASTATITEVKSDNYRGSSNNNNLFFGDGSAQANIFAKGQQNLQLSANGELGNGAKIFLQSGESGSIQLGHFNNNNVMVVNTASGVTVNGALSVSGGVAGTLTVQGAASLQSTLAVTGAATISGETGLAGARASGVFTTTSKIVTTATGAARTLELWNESSTIADYNAVRFFRKRGTNAVNSNQVLGAIQVDSFQTTNGYASNYSLVDTFPGIRWQAAANASANSNPTRIEILNRPTYSASLPYPYNLTNQNTTASSVIATLRHNDSSTDLLTRAFVMRDTYQGFNNTRGAGFTATSGLSTVGEFGLNTIGTADAGNQFTVNLTQAWTSGNGNTNSQNYIRFVGRTNNVNYSSLDTSGSGQINWFNSSNLLTPPSSNSVVKGPNLQLNATRHSLLDKTVSSWAGGAPYTYGGGSNRLWNTSTEAGDVLGTISFQGGLTGSADSNFVEGAVDGVLLRAYAKNNWSGDQTSTNTNVTYTDNQSALRIEITTSTTIGALQTGGLRQQYKTVFEIDSTTATFATVIQSNQNINIADGKNIVLGTTTGTKLGTATTEKLAFYNATPVVQPAAVADATDAASVITQLNALLARMRDLGLIAT